MDNKTLNEFVFAHLLYKHAQIYRAERIESADDKSPKTNKDDLKEALDHLLGIRYDVKELLENTEDIID